VLYRKRYLPENLKKLFCIASVTVILLSLALECHAEDGKARLESGLKAYREEADFDKAISRLQEAVELGLDDPTDLIQAHLHLGFAYIGMGRRMPAEVEFKKAIQLDSTLSLDPKLHSSKIVAVFNETKARLVDSLTVISIPGGAEVYIGAKPVGSTPLKLDDVLVGEHTLRVVKEYFQPKVLNIIVEKDKDNRVQVELDKAEFELTIDSQPPEAAVYVAIEGKFETDPYGKTPVSLKMALDQELAIKLAKEEFLDTELKVKLTEAGFSISGEKLIPAEDGKGEIRVELSPAPPPGSLQVVSDPPGATVYLDGISRGETPLTLAKVTPGIRKLRASMPGFVSVIREVEIISGQEAAVEVELGGRLNILSIPSGARAFIDEKYVGITPLRTERIPAGSYQLRLAKERYKDRLSAVVLSRGQEKEVNGRLLPIKGSIAISSDPPGAVVYLDGENKGSTPVFIYGVMIGQHSLKLTKPGYKDREKQITVEELKISWQFIKLEKSGK
jgi:tetratricopeptide (TPR) repeat protein